MMSTVSDTNIKPDENSAVITFYRPSSLGGMVQAPIVEDVSGDIKFVGISSYKTKIRHLVSPGEHIFAVGGESSSMMKATVLPNKNYYVCVDPCFGIVKSRFELLAIKPDKLQKEIPNIQKCTIVSKNELSNNWFAKNKGSMANKMLNARSKFSKLPQEKQNKYILDEKDGVDIMY